VPCPAAPLEGLPPILAREGSGVFLDIAPGGFAPRPMEPAVLLYPRPRERCNGQASSTKAKAGPMLPVRRCGA
jgi:hypothetical protein